MKIRLLKPTKVGKKTRPVGWESGVTHEVGKKLVKAGKAEEIKQTVYDKQLKQSLENRDKQ